MRLTSGAKLGSYEIVEPIGEGGMGEVYRARDARLNRDVAVKIVHPDLRGADPLVRFRREARVLASICHANVANVYEFEELPEAAFIVMELVPGQTLAARLAHGALPLADSLRVARQVASRDTPLTAPAKPLCIRVPRIIPSRGQYLARPLT